MPTLSALPSVYEKTMARGTVRFASCVSSACVRRATVQRAETNGCLPVCREHDAASRTTAGRVTGHASVSGHHAGLNGRRTVRRRIPHDQQELHHEAPHHCERARQPRNRTSFVVFVVPAHLLPNPLWAGPSPGRWTRARWPGPPRAGRRAPTARPARMTAREEQSKFTCD